MMYVYIVVVFFVWGGKQRYSSNMSLSVRMVVFGTHVHSRPLRQQPSARCLRMRMLVARHLFVVAKGVRCQNAPGAWQRQNPGAQ